MAMSTVIVRLEPKLKKEAEDFFAAVGLTMSAAVNIFLRQTVRRQEIPFRIGRDVPNAETLAAMEEGEQLAHNPKAKTYDDVEAMLRELKEE